ncbi:MAG: leucine-rich repeat protein [Ruminococcus sp.]|nr:leucine-rich repeat protein [Ruminococcus sp.]
MKKFNDIVKRASSVFLCVVLLTTIFMSVPFTVSAGEVTTTVDGVKYYLTSNGWYLEKYTSAAPLNLVIPETIDGYAVTIILDDSFKGSGVKTVEIPDTVTRIGAYAFGNCDSLEEIVIPASVSIMDYYAFFHCDKLTSVTIESGSKLSSIPREAFYFCKSMRSFTVPASVEYIESHAFDGCTGLKTLNFEKGSKLKSIGDFAFRSCSSLESITFPSELERIGEYAFTMCDSLKKVNVNEGLQTIVGCAFYNCCSLLEFYIPDSVIFVGTCALACFDDGEYIYSISEFTVIGSENSLAGEYAEVYGVKYEKVHPAPKLTSISNTDSGIKLSFEKLSSVSGYYRVYRKTAGTSWTKLADVTTSSYTDTTAVAGTKYTYTVKFIGNDGTTSLYDKNGLSITRLKTPSVSKIENTASGAKITFSAVAGASKYRVYYKTSDGWKSIGDTQETSFVHADAVSGTTYTYTVKAFDSDGMSSAHNSTGWSNKYITTPYVNSAEVTNSGVKLTWDKVAGAENYRVFVKNGSSWKGLATVSGATTSYIDKTATAGNTYTYTIRCMDSNGNPVSDYDKDGFTVRYLETPQITGFENIDGGTVITWNGVEGAEKYRLYVKKDGSWTKLADVEGTSYTHFDLVEGTEYTYTIRCVSEDSKIFESGFDSTGFSNIYEKPEITVLTGDADLDGELSVMDASLIQMYLVGKKTIEGDALIAADADLDGEISVLDASLIQMILVGKK